MQLIVSVFKRRPSNYILLQIRYFFSDFKRAVDLPGRTNCGPNIISSAGTRKSSYYSGSEGDKLFNILNNLNSAKGE